MEFVFEIVSEIIMEPFLNFYLPAMMRFSKGKMNVDKQKAKCVVVFECIALFLMFIVGGVMLLETNGESLIGKILFVFSIVVSAVQIISGIVYIRKARVKVDSPRLLV